MATAAMATVILASSASADVFTDSAAFNGANPGLSQIDFEGVVGPDDFFFDARNLYAGDGVLFSHPSFPTNGEISVWGSNTLMFDGTPGASPSSVLGSSLLGAMIRMDFIDSVSSVGFNISTLDFAVFPFGVSDVQIDVFNGGTLLATELVSPMDITDFSSFIGFSNLGSDITSIEFSTSTDGAIFIDNLVFGSVPTPTTLAAFGLGGLVVGRRRR